LLTWLLASTHSTGAQIALIWICTAPISALQFRHSIAGSVEAFYRAASGHAGWGAMLWEFVLPSVLGNAIGGVLLVALLNYGQVAAEKEGGEDGKGGKEKSEKDGPEAW
jgi:formate-nitrite transporter family protein